MPCLAQKYKKLSKPHDSSVLCNDEQLEKVGSGGDATGCCFHLAATPFRFWLDSSPGVSMIRYLFQVIYDILRLEMLQRYGYSIEPPYVDVVMQNRRLPTEAHSCLTESLG